jgi:sulfane dehydrogenase subunit SoxC
MSRERRPDISRRAWIATTSGAVVGAGLIHTQSDAVRLLAQETPPPDPTKVPGRFTTELGTRAPAEQPRRLARAQALSASSQSPLQDLMGVITPADLHFERHHAGVPTIAKDRHELLVHGMVDRPTVFRMSDLERYPQVSRLHFIECSGNGRAAYAPDGLRPDLSVQAMDGLFSTSEWIGVPLSTILREVGVHRGASWLLAEGSDSAALSRSIPLEKAMDDALLAYGQNGEAIRPEQGYPLRLMLPGWEGNAQVKWLRRIEVTDRPTMTREETSKYTDPLGDGTARQFSFVMDAKSVITFPSFGFVLPDRGRSRAWRGRDGAA